MADNMFDRIGEKIFGTERDVKPGRPPWPQERTGGAQAAQAPSREEPPPPPAIDTRSWGERHSLGARPGGSTYGGNTYGGNTRGSSSEQYGPRPEGPRGRDLTGQGAGATAGPAVGGAEPPVNYEPGDTGTLPQPPVEQ